MPAAFQSESSRLWVPESSPREAKGLSERAILARALLGLFLSLDAGGVALRAGNDEVVVHHIETLDPEALLDEGDSRTACGGRRRTSASPLRARRMAWPVPTATTRTSMPVFASKVGSILSNRPEFAVDVVEATTMKRSSAKAPVTAMPDSANRNENLRS